MLMIPWLQDDCHDITPIFSSKGERQRDGGEEKQKPALACHVPVFQIRHSSIRVVWCVLLGRFPLLGKDTKAFVHHEKTFSFPPTVIAKNELCYSHCKEE